MFGLAVGGSALRSWRLRFEVPEDLVDNRLISEERDHPHLVTAFAQQRICLVDTPDQPRPLAAESSPLRRCLRRCLSVLFLLNTRLSIVSPPSPSRARIVTVVANEMQPRSRNVHQQPGQELLWIEGLSVGSSGALVPVSSDGAVEIEPFEGQRWPKQVSSEPLEPGGVVRRYRDSVVRREACVAALPRIEELEAFGSEKPLVVEQGEHLLSEEQLRSLLVDVGHGMPSPVSIPAAT